MNNNFNDVIDNIIKFRNERDWQQFHNPKDLAISISIEANELLECFQWKSIEEVREITKNIKTSNIADEIADVAIYLLLMCSELNLDLLDLIDLKIRKNAEKYPIDKSKGNAKKYNKF